MLAMAEVFARRMQSGIRGRGSGHDLKCDGSCFVAGVLVAADSVENAVAVET
jgi:hypothetical protein